MYKKLLFGLFLVNVVMSTVVVAQSSDQYKKLLASNKNDLFPKVLIYDGPKLPISYQYYIRLGFDYISVYSIDKPQSIPNRFKYVLWTGVASNNGKGKWALQKSPFVDDIHQYANRWNSRLNHYKKSYDNPNDRDDIGLMILDIEAKKNNGELRKNPPFRSGGTRNKAMAIAEYKTAMEELYRYPLEFAQKNHNYYEKWSSYGDVPVERNWWDIPSQSWHKWSTNPSHLNYITHKISNGKAFETEFSKQLDFYSVSTYFFYSPKFSDSNTANQYLAYLLFQLEANQAWTKKPIYLYFWFQYQASKERGTLISNDMVRNSVIFAFLSGADGMVLYDDSRKATNDREYHALIKTFIESISSLDKYRSYFTDKNATFYKPDNARDLFADRKPVIRGIEKGGKLLLAATNPFAKVDELTNLSVTYKGEIIKIQLKGKETYLREILL